MDLTTLGAFLVSTASFIGAILAYLRGRKGDDALNLSTRMEQLLGGQRGLIDDLRLEADRNRKGWDDCLARCDRLREDNEELHRQIEVLREALDALR